MINFHFIERESYLLESTFILSSYMEYGRSLCSETDNFINPEKSLVSYSNQLNLLTKGNSNHMTPSCAPLDGEPNFTSANIHN